MKKLTAKKGTPEPIKAKEIHLSEKMLSVTYDIPDWIRVIRSINYLLSIIGLDVTDQPIDEELQALFYLSNLSNEVLTEIINIIESNPLLLPANK